MTQQIDWGRVNDVFWLRIGESYPMIKHLCDQLATSYPDIWLRVSPMIDSNPVNISFAVDADSRVRADTPSWLFIGLVMAVARYSAIESFQQELSRVVSRVTESEVESDNKRIEIKNLQERVRDLEQRLEIPRGYFEDK